MAEIFTNSGIDDSNISVPSPQLQGLFIPGIDDSAAVDGFGIVTPWGGGSTTRKYGPYGISPDVSTQNTQLYDLASSFLPAEGKGFGTSFNLEGLIGPQGNPGRDGTTLIIHQWEGVNSNYLTALPHNLDLINGLGTATDKLIYTDSHTSYGGTLTWTERQPAGASDKNWRSVDSDSDGSNLIASASSGRIYISTDFGVNWSETRPNGDSSFAWRSVASDADGSHLIAGVEGGRLYTSSDGGVNWTERRPAGAANKNWYAVASDDDGSNLIAAIYNGRLYTSSDFGVSWSERQPAGAQDNFWSCVASDSDGSNLIVGIGNIPAGALYTSVDSGVNWTVRQPTGVAALWVSVDSDSDGSNLIAGAQNGRIAISDDGGATWTLKGAGGGDNWAGMASDADGSHLLVCSVLPTGNLYESSDSGATFAATQPAGATTKDWYWASSNSDGTRLIVCVYNGRLYTGARDISYSEATWAESDLTSAGRAILDDATAADQATTLGLGVGDAVTHDTLTLSSIAHEVTDVDKFLVENSGLIKYRTGDEVLSDIGASASAHLHDTQTLQHDAVNSDGGAFSFTTTGLVTFNQSIAAANYAAANLLTAAANNAGEIDFTAASKKLDVEDNAVVSQDYSSDASPTWAGATLTGLTDDSLIYPSSSVLTPLGVAANGQLPIGSTGTTPILATLTGTTDHVSVSNGAGSITLDLDTNTQTLLGSFNGIFLEKLNFTISEAGGTVTGSLEQDGGGDLIQRFSDGYTALDCTPARTIDLTAYVGTDAVPKEVFIYILQTAKTTIVASNVDWPLDPELEHIKIAHLVLKSAVTTGTDGGALMNQNHNDYAFDATGEGHLQDIEHRLRQEPAQYHSGIALTLKNAAGAALTTGNSSTAVELVNTTGHVFQIHQHNFPAFDMYSVATDKADIVNQPTDEGGNYETTVDLVTDITHYVDGTAAGVAIGVNKYFNLVIWGVMNRSGETSFLMINLPTSQYTTSGNAVADIDGTSIFEIPSAFKGTGFLIARLTFRLIGGSQWTYIAQEDLRGKFPDIIAGVGITTTDHALLANLIAPADDHTQYVLADGTRALAGAWDMGSQALTNVNIDSGVITGITDLAIADGGTGQSTAQLAINALSAVSGATNEHVLTKDTGTGNATFKAAAATFVALTDTPANFTGSAGKYAAVNSGENALEFIAGISTGAGMGYVKLVDTKAQNTAGGTFTSGAWQTRVLNTEEEDINNDCSLASNQITLEAGTYECQISCPVFHVNRHQTRLYNTTGAVVVLLGTSEYSAVGAPPQPANRSFISGRFTIAASQALEVQHICQTTQATQGFGVENNFTSEVYTVAVFIRTDTASTTDEKVGIDSAATPSYLGATAGDGVLRVATGIDYADGGDFITLDYDINALAADGSPDGAADYVVTWDNSAGSHKKVLLDNIGGGGGSGYLGYIKLTDTKAQNTTSGTFTQAAWQTRILNTEDSDTNNDCSLSSNQITLDAGTYECHITCPAYNCRRHQTRLYNITGAAVVLLGSSIDTTTSQNSSSVVGRFTIAASQALEVQHQCQVTSATRGFGVEANIASEIYCVAEFWRVS